MPIVETILHALLHAVKDSLPLLPFLYLTYLLMELLEHKAGERIQGFIRRSGRVGPLVGGLLGMLPQCGFSAAAAGLYAGRVVSLGTMLAVFLSTSDEMLPILLSHSLPPMRVLLLVGVKALIAIVVGLVVDLLLRPRHTQEEEPIEELCRRDGCHCEGKNVFLAALLHTAQVALYILLATFALGVVIELVGEEQLGSFVFNLPIVGSLMAALIGLIPNCAASVLLTELHLAGALSLGAMLSGLLVSSGVGLLVLFRTNRRHMKENLLILALLYVVGSCIGILLDISGLGNLLSLA